MSSTDVPISSVIRSIWSRMVRCTVTSRADVGSSAMSSRGRQASPIAMSARWRMPPENSCGYCRARRSGSGSPAAASAATTFSSTSRRVASPCTSRVSATWRPTVVTGLRLDMGSCGTRPICRPRIRRIRASSRPTSSWPAKRTEPPVTRPLPGSSPITDMAVVDLPEPDSPTMARVRPSRSVRDASWTAWTGPFIVLKATARFSTSSSGAASAPGAWFSGLIGRCTSRGS